MVSSPLAEPSRVYRRTHLLVLFTKTRHGKSIIMALPMPTFRLFLRLVAHGRTGNDVHCCRDDFGNCRIVCGAEEEVNFE